MKKNIAFIVVLLFAVGLTLSAKEKAIATKKFKSTDIGNPELAGATVTGNDKIEITAGGADVWGVRDEFHFAYFEQTGDFDLVTQIESLTEANLYTKAGIMAREDLSDNSRHIFFQVFPNNNARNKNNGGYEFQYRKDKDGEMKAIYPARFDGVPEFPVNFPNTWIRLKRAGNIFTGYYSADGRTWKIYTEFTMEIAQKLYLGMAVTSHNTNKKTSAIFRNIASLK